VEAMARVLGTDVREAAALTVRILIDAQRRHVAIPGHDWCQEAADILRRFPATVQPTDGTCAAELAAR